VAHWRTGDWNNERGWSEGLACLLMPFPRSKLAGTRQLMTVRIASRRRRRFVQVVPRRATPFVMFRSVNRTAFTWCTGREAVSTAPAAELLDVSEEAIRGRIADDALPGVTMQGGAWRIPVSSLRVLHLAPTVASPYGVEPPPYIQRLVEQLGAFDTGTIPCAAVARIAGIGIKAMRSDRDRVAFLEATLSVDRGWSPSLSLASTTDRFSQGRTRPDLHLCWRRIARPSRWALPVLNGLGLLRHESTAFARDPGKRDLILFRRHCPLAGSVDAEGFDPDIREHGN
jgi:hypothetical protein